MDSFIRALYWSTSKIWSSATCVKSMGRSLAKARVTVKSLATLGTDWMSNRRANWSATTKTALCHES